MRYKVWRSNKDKRLHLLCAEGAEAFEALPVAVRGMGPWTGGPEGAIDRLRLPFHHVMLSHQQCFTVVYAPVALLELEMTLALCMARHRQIRGARSTIATATYHGTGGLRQKT